MKLAFLNIIINALEAMEAKKDGRLVIETKADKGMCRITISDNGMGIPSPILNKIFQPFFTTKPTGQGTGLGLSLAYDIVKAHGGEIIVEIKEGKGTEFIIQLPITSNIQ